MKFHGIFQGPISLRLEKYKKIEIQDEVSKSLDLEKKTSFKIHFYYSDELFYSDSSLNDFSVIFPNFSIEIRSR